MAKKPTDEQKLKEKEQKIECQEEYEKFLTNTVEVAEDISDVAKTAYSTVATAYAVGVDVVSVYNKIASSLNQEKPLCSPGDTTGAEEQGDFFDLSDEIKRCLGNPSGEFNGQPTGCQSEIWASIKGAEFDLASILDILGQLTKSRSITQCISPYYDRFFNLVPYQFYISRMIEDTLGSTLKTLIAALPDENDPFYKDIPCGREEMMRILNAGMGPDLPPFPEIPALPPIPYIKIPSLLQIIRNIFIDFLCWSMCCLLSNLLKASVLKMNELDKYLVELGDFGSDTIDPSFSIDKRFGNLKKVNLNDFVDDELLEEARQNRYISSSATISEIRDYLAVVSSEDTKIIEQKHVIYLLMGEADCKRMNFLLSLDPLHPTLELKTDQRIINFFKLLGRRINMFDFIEQSQDGLCRPDFCVEMDADMIDKFQNSLKDLCNLMNPEFTMPEVPLLLLIKATEADKAIIGSIETQSEMLFEQAKSAVGVGSNNVVARYLYPNPKDPNEKNVNAVEIEILKQSPGIVIEEENGEEFFRNRTSKDVITKLFKSKIAGKTLKDVEDTNNMFLTKKRMISSSYLRDLEGIYEDEKIKFLETKKKDAQDNIKAP